MLSRVRPRRTPLLSVGTVRSAGHGVGSLPTTVATRLHLMRHRPSSGCGALQFISRGAAVVDLGRHSDRDAVGVRQFRQHDFSTASPRTREAPPIRRRSPDPLRATTAGGRARESVGRASAHQFVDNEHGHNYTQVGGPVDPSVCPLSLSDIHSRLRERVRCQRARDFEGANAVEDELKAAGVNFDNNAKLWRADGRSYGFQVAAKRKELGINIPMVAGCPSLTGAADLTHGHLDLLTPRQIAAFWAAAPALLQKEGATSGRGASTLKEQLESILIRTLEDMGTYRPKDSSTTALGLARLTKAVGDPAVELPFGGAHRTLRDLLVGDDDDRQRFIFQTIAEAVPSLQEFDSRDVSNFIYAFATVGYVPKSNDGHTLFDRAAGKVMASLERGEKFAPEELTSILWSFAAVDECHPQLFAKIGDHIAAFDAIGAFKPLGLANIVLSFAKAKVSHPELFRRIADYIAGPKELDAFNSKDLSGLISAYGSAAEAHLPLFEKIARHVLESGDAVSLGRQSLGRLSNALYKSHPELSARIADRIVLPVTDTEGGGRSLGGQALNKFGHDFTKVGGPVDPSVCTLKEAEIHKLLRERMVFRTTGIYAKSDLLRTELRQSGVSLDDDSGSWRADGRTFGVPRFAECRSLGEAIGSACEHLDKLKPGDVAAFWSAVPRLYLSDGRAQPLNGNSQAVAHLKTILERTLKDIATFPLRELASITSGLARIVKVVEKESQGNGHALHAALIGEGEEKKNSIFQSIAESLLPVLHILKPGALSSIISSFALAGCEPTFDDGSTFFGEVAAEVVNAIETAPESFEPRQLSSIVRAFSRIDEHCPEVFEVVADYVAAPGSLESLDSRAISTIAKDYAKLGESYPELFSELANHIVSDGSVGDFTARDLSSTVWAFAKAEEPQPELFKEVAATIVASDNFNSFNGQDLSDTVWSYAKAKEPSPELFGKVGDYIASLDTLDSFRTRSLSNIILAYASAQESHPKLFKRVGDHIVSLASLSGFNAQDISNAVWAYATAEEPHPELFLNVADHVASLDNLNAFNMQNLPNTVWAFATAKESHAELFKKVAEAAIERQHELSSQGIANLLWAYAANGEVDESLFHSLAPTAEALLGKCNGQEVANIAWAYAVANVDEQSLFDTAFVDACVEKESDFAVEELRQLHQWCLWQQELKSGVGLPPSLEKRCYNAFVLQEARPSTLQKDVVSELVSMGLHPKEEVRTESGYSLDALVEINGAKIGIEVDGPSHFLAKEPAGGTLMKRRQIACLDEISVVSVPFWEWEQLGKEQTKKQEYLRSLLGVH